MLPVNDKFVASSLAQIKFLGVSIHAHRNKFLELQFYRMFKRIVFTKDHLWKSYVSTSFGSLDWHDIMTSKQIEGISRWLQSHVRYSPFIRLENLS